MNYLKNEVIVAALNIGGRFYPIGSDFYLTVHLIGGQSLLVKVSNPVGGQLEMTAIDDKGGTCPIVFPATGGIAAIEVH